MRRSFLVFLAFFIQSSAFSQSTLDVTFIANCGFLLTDGNHKVLIDAIFSEGSGMFTTPPDEILLKERDAEEPFNNIDILLSTHYHADHINADYEAEHLLNDTLSRWLGPPQVYDLLTETNNFDEIQERLFPLLPETGEKIDTALNLFSFRVLRLVHYNNPENIIQNLGFIFTLGNINIFHPGDGFLNDTTEITNLDLATDSIDLLFLSYRVLDNNFDNLGRKIINYLHPKAMILMHIPLNQTAHYREVVEGLEDLPPIYIMEEQMGTLNFEKSEDSLIVTNYVGIPQIEVTPASLFPNPAGESVMIRLPGRDFSESAHIELWNLFGDRRIFRIITPGISEVTINLQDYPSGLYFIKIQEGNTSQSLTLCHE
jgi:L-ascorbate metabolism protein UlaG (beta-lactamase superfamily)